MSSSPSRVRLSSAAVPPLPTRESSSSPFLYDEVPSTGVGKFSARAVQSASLAATNESATREAQAREAGRQQGLLEVRKQFEEQLGREREAIAKALSQFSRERAAYYRKIEEGSVQLALSIARKILHREAQVDPLLLMGIVRVALEQVEGASGVVLAVSAQRAPEWQRYLASRMEPGDMPEIVEDAAMAEGRCELRTSMGTATLGVEVQLKEIEQGLMDLLSARPKAAL